MVEAVASVAAMPWHPFLERGDGHPVMVIPGFGGSDLSTRSLRGFLLELGYVVHGWGGGTLMTETPQVLARLQAQVESIVQEEGRCVSLVGWSLGGIIARHLALGHPERIRCVITMGTMLRGDLSSTTMGRLSKLVRTVTGKGEAARPRSLHESPVSVPLTAIYSKTDGIVPWRACIEDEGPQRESVHVPSSHSGFVLNPLVRYVIADRLAQPEGQWHPFKMGLIPNRRG